MSYGDTGSHRHTSPKGVALTIFLRPSTTLPAGVLSPDTQALIPAPMSAPWPLFDSDRLFEAGAAAAWACGGGAASAIISVRPTNTSMSLCNYFLLHST